MVNAMRFLRIIFAILVIALIYTFFVYIQMGGYDYGDILPELSRLIGLLK